MKELSALLAAANVESWSSREIAAKAKALGFPVGHATINNYLAGRVPKRPSEDVLRALEAVLKIPLAKLRSAANLSASITDVTLPAEAARLTPRQWAAVHEIIMSMVNPGESAADDELTTRRKQEARDAAVVERTATSAAAARKGQKGKG